MLRMRPWNKKYVYLFLFRRSFQWYYCDAEIIVQTPSKGGIWVKILMISTIFTCLEILHDINNFHMSRNIAVDVMHDFREGVCRYDIGFLLNNFIYEKQLFTLEILNLNVLTSSMHFLFQYVSLHFPSPRYRLSELHPSCPIVALVTAAVDVGASREFRFVRSPLA